MIKKSDNGLRSPSCPYNSLNASAENVKKMESRNHGQSPSYFSHVLFWKCTHCSNQSSNPPLNAGELFLFQDTHPLCFQMSASY